MVVSVHALWFAIGALVCALVYFWLSKGVNQFKLYEALEDTGVIFFAGLVGSRLAYVFFYNDGHSVLDYLAFWRLGLVSYGGIVAGSGALWWLMTRRRRGPRYRDNFSLAMLVGWAVGRVGNFLARDAYGVLNYRVGDLFYGRVPIQLFEMAGLLMLFALGLGLRRKWSKSGWVYWYCLVGYGGLRLVVDTWRDLPAVLGPFNISQLFAMSLSVCGIIGLLLWQKRKPV